ncbi:MAG: rRNA pseudouridine synthase [Taibaiella sp.]|nr:rRNA pseudouridine synthase [Taibaiella sp.]
MPLGKKSREDYKRDTYADAPEFKPRKAKTKPEIEDEAEYYGDNDEWEVSGDKRAKRPTAATYPMPLNKYIAHSGECSRRDAAELVKQGKAKVNGELITDPGHKINEGDQVTLSGKKLKPQKGLVYLLLNKPKGFITTSEDERGRRTVMDLVANAEVGRVYPVGRLDRATTGLILLTNDGTLAQKLSHPSYNVKKVYHVTLDKPLTKADFDKIVEGVELEDGKAPVDEIAYLDKKNELGLEIHSGKNRIVRRIFESLGYVVDKLDRMMYAGLTKKNLPRGKWRFLDEREIVLLKHFKS